ncbi:arginase/agmatinase/formimionoglutamate hydrolase, arginase family [Bacillus sp. OxB-1]|uniref:agmatinase n=1 Tax=Bacillus sp. (strain OxB-1) TaxID=98228 RepID=UPI000581BB3E|nr:agmatinase [Bacillus sp. OxB-1]BAQ08894.1 arginase/agmatinase/formimionoglutamate hydrolase, arginase family [Bacillus sp. OxB-1]
MKNRVDIPAVGICSFGRNSICTDLDQLDADVAIIGVPYDMGTAYRAGARLAPRRIREASTLGNNEEGFYDHERNEVFLKGVKIVDCGDVDILHGDLTYSFKNIEEDVRKIVKKGALPVVIGGDHSITAAIGKGLNQVGDFCVIQIDAHLDWSDAPGGQKLGQGSPMRRLSEMDYVNGMAQLGIRGVGSSYKKDFEDANEYGSVIKSVKQIREIGIHNIGDYIPDAERYYITLDIDGLDPSIAPGTGTPSAGGFLFHEIQTILETIANKGEVIGFDLVEVAPDYDPSGITSHLAQQLINEFLGFIFKAKEKRYQLSQNEVNLV